MKVYVLNNSWDYHGNTGYDVIGVYSTLKSAQISLGEELCKDLEYCELPDFEDQDNNDTLAYFEKGEPCLCTYARFFDKSLKSFDFISYDIDERELYE